MNVVRQPQPGKATTVARLDLNDAKKRQVMATFDASQLRGNIAATTRPHRVSVSLDGRQIVRAGVPVRAPLRHQIQLKNRTVHVASPQITRSEPSTSTTRTASIPSAVVANLLQKNLPKSGQKIAISGAMANVQAIAFTTSAQLKARPARLVAHPAAAHAANR